MRKVNPYILSTLSHRFDEQVLEADILNWLYNFDEKDWNCAITLLNQVTFYSEHRMSAVLESGLKEIVSKHPQEEMLVCPIGGIGKSGGVMAYMLRKLMGRFSKVKWQFLDATTNLQQKPYKVMLLDDFVGTGESAMKLYDEVKVKMPQGCLYYCLCVVSMERGAQRLEKAGIEMMGDRHLPAFAYRRSVFGSAEKMRPIKDFAERYGSLLYPKQPYQKGMKLYIGPMGYGNCQALVCFDHTTPNNTLPILWEGKFRNDQHKRWNPLFPRRLYDRTKCQDDFEHRKYLWLSIAMKITAGKVLRPFNNYNKETIQLLGLLSCKIHRRSEAYTCVMLEIIPNELVALCAKAVNIGLIDDGGNVTEAGRQLYQRIRREESKHLEFVKEESAVFEDMRPYIPKEFLGEPRYKAISDKSKNWKNCVLRFLQSLDCKRRVK